MSLSPRTVTPKVSRFSDVNESTVCSVIRFSTNSLAYVFNSVSGIPASRRNEIHEGWFHNCSTIFKSSVIPTEIKQ